MINRLMKLLLPIIVLITPLYANTYVVAESGGDFTSIQDAINTAVAGDTILVKEKSEPYSELISFVRSGNESDGYIVLMAYPGEHPVIDATNVNLGGSWRVGIVSIVNKNYIEINGFEIRNLITSDGDKFPAGIWVLGKSHDIRILNNKIHNIEHHDSDAGAHGLAVYGTYASSSIHNLLIQGNEIYNCILGWSESLVLNGNVENFVVKENVVHDNDNIGYDFIGFEGTCSDEQYDRARNGVVVDNIAYNIDSRTNPAYGGDGSADGFYVDGGKDILFERNTAFNCNIGFEFASEHGGKTTENITARNNYIFSNHYVGLAIGGYDSQRGSTVNCKIVNNTFYHNGTENDWGGEFYIQYYCQNNVFKNNIIYASGNVPIFDYYNTSGEGFEINNNLYFSDGGHLWIWQGTYYNEFSQYSEATGNDGNSVYSNPQFDSNSLQNNIPEITQDSPAINKGETLSTDIIGETDFCGNTRVIGDTVDIGACEYQHSSAVNENITPENFVLYPPYPNPFNPVTTIEYSIPNVWAKNFSSQQNIQLKIYDELGREISTLVDKKQSPGLYKIKFNAMNLSSGLYFCVLKAGMKTITTKMILLK